MRALQGLRIRTESGRDKHLIPLAQEHNSGVRGRKGQTTEFERSYTDGVPNLLLHMEGAWGVVLMMVLDSEESLCISQARDAGGFVYEEGIENGGLNAGPAIRER